MTTTYPMSLVLSVGQPLKLDKIQPGERKLAFADEVVRAVESTVQQVGGDGEREPSWIEFDTWLRTSGRPSERAAALGAFEAALRYAVRAEIDGLTYPITRIRVTTRAPTGRGYRLTVSMIGPHFDFQDAQGNPAPLW
ncbi:hypothetical protein DAETH_48040 (plasmid) [Deinococcus aetherius]|uniref:Uncharacterized protein n=1 Tax=Deinococcus aetherius TaxID=200252 RepID=A0ABM8ALV7_9DEIO|nr:hypothetical protein [Deinococcus aetherius]BDP44835.1 hypothetical protein DAETH_48040 [Deinococcus aetherius]